MESYSSKELNNLTRFVLEAEIASHTQKADVRYRAANDEESSIVYPSVLMSSFFNLRDYVEKTNVRTMTKEYRKAPGTLELVINTY